MAPLPDNNTCILFTDYVANGKGHTMQIRYSGSGAPGSSFLEGLDEWFTACNGAMPVDWAFVAWRYQDLRTNWSVPLDLAPTPFAGTILADPGKAPCFLGIQGRSRGGRRGGWFLMGAGQSALDSASFKNYRIEAGENSVYNGIISSAVDLGGAVAIDGEAMIIKPYVNIGFNAYWQRAAR